MKTAEEEGRTCYGFGPFRLDPLRRMLQKNDRSVPLSGKAFDTLLALLENPGEIMETDALMRRVWPGTAAEENNLTQSIAAIRRALGDREREHRYVVTIVGRGYSFASPVTKVPCLAPRLVSGARLLRLGTGSWATAVLLGAVAVWTSQSDVLRATLGDRLDVFKFGDRVTQIPPLRFTIAPPGRTSFVRVDGAVRSLAVSPDGSRVVFSVKSDNGTQLWVRSLNQLAAQPLPGTADAVFPFWSPDSRSIGFAAGGKLKRLDVDGGPAVALADAANFRGATWNGDDVILFAGSPGEPLRRVSAAGGSVVPVTEISRPEVEVDHLWPWFLSDGTRFLFSAAAASKRQFYIRAGRLDSRETSPVIHADSNAVYAQGYLLFLLQSTLMAQRFDARNLKTIGPAVPLAENVGRLPAGRASFSVSEDLLVYAASQQTQLAWFDRSGKRLSMVGDPGLLGRMHMSRDGRNAAVAVTLDNNTDIWIYDTHRGVRTRLTFDAASEMIGVWSPDGRMLAFDSSRKGRHDLYSKAADGTGTEQEIYADTLEKGPTSWSPDGKVLVYNSLSPKSGWDIWSLSMHSDRQGAALQPRPFLTTDFNEQQTQFSPDGRWVAYMSDESGRNEVYVALFPSAAAKRKISSNGGSQPRWLRDGKEIFFVSANGMLTSVAVNAKGLTVQIGDTRPLFAPLIAPQGFSYDVSADGQRILTRVPAEDASGGQDVLTIVQNWRAALDH